LAKHGIQHICLPHLPRTYFYGLALRLPDGSPVIGLMLRHDGVDNYRGMKGGAPSTFEEPVLQDPAAIPATRRGFCPETRRLNWLRKKLHVQTQNGVCPESTENGRGVQQLIFSGRAVK
jgi:hypothetical protein